MINISVKSVGDSNAKAFKAKLERMRSISFDNLGEMARKRMIWKIDNSRKRDVKTVDERYQGAYAQHIKDILKVYVGKDGSVTVGDTSELDALVPYWMLLNEGGVIQGHPRGYFTDGQPQAGNGGGSASFEYDADGPRMDPIKPMEGIHYLEDMYQWVDENFQQYISDCIDQTRGLTSNDIESE